MVVVFVTLMAAFSMQTGYFLWKVASIKLPIIGENPIKKVIWAFLTSPRWILGMFCTFVGWLLFVKATDLGEVSIVQPLMSVGDLFLVIVAVTYLHERLNRREWIGLVLTIIGAVVLATEARVIEPLSIEWVSFVVFLFATGIGFIPLLFFGKGKQRGEVILSVAVGLSFGLGAILTELLTASLSLGGKNLDLESFFMNPILPLMIAANIAGIVLLQVAFQKGRAAVVIPVQLSIANGLVVLASIIIFSESITVMRLVGISLIIAGTGMLYRLSD